MINRNENGILEIKAISDCLPSIQFDSWLILDLDNTVMEPMIDLGSDQWFSSLYTFFCEQIKNKEEAFECVFALLNAIQHHLRMKAVQPEIILIIKALQDIGIPVLALTARNTSLIDTTLRQLAELGIDFLRNSHLHNTFKSENDKENLGCYDRGIIFCSGQNKGDCIKPFLEHCKHIVMADDKEAHLRHVLNTARGLKKRFSGLRYGFLDEKVKQFELEKTHIQLSYLYDKLPQSIQSIIQKLKKVPSNVSQMEYEDFPFYIQEKKEDNHTSSKNHEKSDALKNTPKINHSLFQHRSKSCPEWIGKNKESQAIKIR